ncbi:MAG: hypothetical protein RR508_01885 [Oscillospiraceae bacterium]
MDNSTLWQAFENTGSINDYLKYKKLEAHNDAAYDDGACNKSGENGRSR